MKKNLHFIFIILLVISLPNFLFAQKPTQNSIDDPRILSAKEIKQGVEINGLSKWFEGDNMNFASKDFDDKNWKVIAISIKKSDKKIQPHWIRYYFKIDSTMINTPICFDVKQLGASEIYLNGKKIETTGKIDKNKSEYRIKKEFPTIFSLSDTSVNVLAVRFMPISNKENIIVSFSPVILELKLHSANEFLAKKVKSIQEINFITMLICGIFLALGFIHLLLFLFYRKAIYNFYFSIYNLSISLLSYVILLFYEITDPSEINTYTFFTFLSLLLFGASLTGFINTLFGKRKLRLKIMLGIAGFFLIFYYFKPGISLVLMLIYIMVAAVESFILIVRAMIRKEKSAFIVGGGILTFFVFVILFILLNLLDSLHIIDQDKLFDDEFSNYVLSFLFISFPISISAYLAWQFASTNLSLVKQLDEVNRLSDITLKQEQEKQQILKNQNDILEVQVNERTQELLQEKHKTENLLLNILPHEVAEELKENGNSQAKYYDEVTVLFTDFANFTESSEKMGAEKMLSELNECFTAFDLIMDKHGLEKIKTIGDAYLAVCGLPTKNKNHAYKAILAALDIIKFIQERKKNNSDVLDIRIGINSGSLIAGIVGVKKFAYDIWGDTVNTAARMEQNSEKGKINISKSTYDLVKDKIVCEYRGKIYTKGKGDMDMYFAIETKKDF